MAFHALWVEIRRRRAPIPSKEKKKKKTTVEKASDEKTTKIRVEIEWKPEGISPRGRPKKRIRRNPKRSKAMSKTLAYMMINRYRRLYGGRRFEKSVGVGN